jgi:hypothetical protein
MATETTEPTKEESTGEEPPGLWAWILKVSAAVGLTGMICCVAPMVLFLIGLMGGIYAISFANFFYHPDGSAAFGAWALRGVAAMVGIAGFLMYRKKQNQCSIDPKRKRRNLILVGVLILILGVGSYVTFEELSAWYFDEYIVPAQQQEYEMMEQ